MGNRKVLIAAMMTAFMTTFMSSALNLSVPALERYFDVSAASISWIVSAYTITVAAASLPFGKIADITSRRRIFLTGITGFGLLCFACIFVRHIAILITLRALMGCCGAMIFATNNAILISSYPSDMRGKVIGYSTAATYIGLTAGPVVGGILNSTLGWRSIFALSVAVSAAALTAASFAPPDKPEPHDSKNHKHFDSTGLILYVFAIASSLYGMTNLDAGAVSVTLLICGLVALVIFYRHESQSPDPIMKVSMFRESRTFTFSNLAALLNYGATFAISYTISIYLQVILGFSSGSAGLLLISMPAVQAIFSPLTGSLSDKFRPSVLASTGMGICAFTLILFSRIGETTHVAYIIFALCLTGFGFALFSSPNTNAILSCVSREDYGVANSIVATMRTYGQSSGMAVLSVITSVILGTASLAESPATDILRMMHTSFIIFAGICIIGLFFSLARDK
ncbi:MAG: MFS transporter [Mogibacterium sp.]|nr:MFS transporter [Mogibacterium sp.]